MAAEPEWLRLFQCVICLETAHEPVRPWHSPPVHTDCGVVLCPPCFDQWRRTANPTCPKCRAEVVYLGMSADGPLVGGGGAPDPLLMRLARELPAVATAPTPVPVPVPLAPPPRVADRKPSSPPPPRVAAYTHRQPITIAAMQAVLRELDGAITAAVRSGRHHWTDALVTTTTLVVDDAEAALLPVDHPRSFLDLDLRLGWSRRLRWPSEQTLRAVLAVCRCVRPGALSNAVVNDILAVRTVVGALVALERWCREHPGDHAAMGLRLAILDGATEEDPTPYVRVARRAYGPS